MIGAYVVSVGEALETLGRFKQAAALYGEVAQHYQSGHLYEHRSIISAGLAFKRAKHFGQAFEWYARGLKALDTYLGGSWDFKDEDKDSAISNLLVLYDQDHRNRVRRRTETGFFVASPDELLCNAFANLLKAARFYPKKQMARWKLDACIEGIGGPILKPKNERPKVAKKILINMFKTGSHGEHKKTLLSVLWSSSFALKALPSLEDHIEKTRKDAKKAARHFIKETCMNDKRQLLGCSHCKEMEQRAETFLGSHHILLLKVLSKERLEGTQENLPLAF